MVIVMWYDFLRTVNVPAGNYLEYVKSVNTTEKEAVRICRAEGLKFQNSFLTLREHKGIGFIDLPSWEVQWAPDSMPDSIFRDTCGDNI